MHIVLPPLLVALLLGVECAGANSITETPRPTPTISAAPTCEARTVNYITDVLPQQCLKSSWSSANGPARSGEGGEKLEGGASGNGTQSAGGHNATSVFQAPDAQEGTRSSVAEVADAAATDLETGELNEASFLSFEEWKKQTLEKAGQANANGGGKRIPESKKRDLDSIPSNLESLSEEDEIDLHFGAFRSGGKEQARAEDPTDKVQELVVVEERKIEQYRSKDAGKTCKERFSYASFDAGATILKTHPGAKNPKAVLIENKDSYMLTECTVENKFIIIELSEDIWIDTVVLANYEFFSSMIRTFRVSLSDRYPVKIDKWKDAGTYEARNSREIQAFLISNPQIWARYIRIEFLSHYGNEYYCPLSLVRVHGTRMLESWKETEAIDAGEEREEVEAGEDEQFVPEAVAEELQMAEKLKAASDETATASMARLADPFLDTTQDGIGNWSLETQMDITTSWGQSGAHIFRDTRLDVTCHISECPAPEAIYIGPIGPTSLPVASSQPAGQGIVATSSTAATTAHPSTATPIAESAAAQSATSKASSVASTSDTTESVSDRPTPAPPSTSTQKVATNFTIPKNKTTAASSASPPLPTIQESFFEAVSRRLNFLESNSTLSLKYIEEQSRILREAFNKVEKKQLQKTTTFLDTLNSTVLDELRQFRQQYDEIWQSTVISLETQRDESRREIMAISSRLNILADEVIFQKRMSIVQSVLLLLCLALVIFSRVSAGTNLEIPYLHSRLHSRVRMFSGFPTESPLDTPEYRRANESGSGRMWMGGGRRAHLEDDDGMAYSPGDERAPSPPSAGGEDIHARVNGAEEPPDSAPLSQSQTPATRASPDSLYSTSQAQGHTASPKKRNSKKRKGFNRPQDTTRESPVDGERPALLSSPAHTPTIAIQNPSPTRQQHLSTSPSKAADNHQPTFQTSPSETDPFPELELPLPPPPPRNSPLPSPSPVPLPSYITTPPPQEKHDRFPSSSSPPPDYEPKDSLSTARKPLPALPPDD